MIYSNCLKSFVASGHLSSVLIFPFTAAAGKSTFIRLLEESSPSYRVISEPLTRWLNVPQEEEVRKRERGEGGRGEGGGGRGEEGGRGREEEGGE